MRNVRANQLHIATPCKTVTYNFCDFAKLQSQKNHKILIDVNDCERDAYEGTVGVL